MQNKQENKIRENEKKKRDLFKVNSYYEEHIKQLDIIKK
jgi:hypothetical protein